MSVAGHRKGFQDEQGQQTRSGLFFEIVRLLAGLREEDRPKYLLCENVKGLMSVDGGIGVKGSGFLRVLIELDGLGYDAEWQILNSKDWDVPQNRERVFLVGHLRGRAGRRQVFPLRPADGENPDELKQIGKSTWVGGSNPQAGRVYDVNGLAPTLKCPTGGAAPL